MTLKTPNEKGGVELPTNADDDETFTRVKPKTWESAFKMICDKLKLDKETREAFTNIDCKDIRNNEKLDKICDNVIVVCGSSITKTMLVSLCKTNGILNTGSKSKMMARVTTKIVGILK